MGNNPDEVFMRFFRDMEERRVLYDIDYADMCDCPECEAERAVCDCEECEAERADMCDCPECRAGRIPREVLAYSPKYEPKRPRAGTGKGARKGKGSTSGEAASSEVAETSKATKTSSASECPRDRKCKSRWDAFQNRCAVCARRMKESKGGTLWLAYRSKAYVKDTTNKILEMLSWASTEKLYVRISLKWFDAAFMEGDAVVFINLMEAHARGIANTTQGRSARKVEKYLMEKSKMAEELINRYFEKPGSARKVQFPPNLLPFIDFLIQSYVTSDPREAETKTIFFLEGYGVQISRAIFRNRDSYRTEEEVVEVWRLLDKYKAESAESNDVWGLLKGAEMAFKFGILSLFERFCTEIMKVSIQADQKEVVFSILYRLARSLGDFAPGCFPEQSAGEHTPCKYFEAVKSRLKDEEDFHSIRNLFVESIIRLISTATRGGIAERWGFEILDWMRQAKFKFDNRHMDIAFTCLSESVVTYFHEVAGVGFGDHAWYYMQKTMEGLRISMFDYLIEKGAIGEKPDVDRLKTLLLDMCENGQNIKRIVFDEDVEERLALFVEAIEQLTDASEEDKETLRHIHDLFDEHKESMSEGVYIKVMQFIQRAHDEAEDVREDDELRRKIEQVIADRLGVLIDLD